MTLIESKNYLLRQGFNPIAVDKFAAIFEDIKDAYYLPSLPSLAKYTVMDIISDIKEEPDFIYFMDCLLTLIKP